MVTIHQQSLDFEAAFQALDAHHRPPLKWQTRLFERFVCGNVPGVCRLPTGLGKTSVIPIWLIALACGKRLPRRLVYIVNRRTVVDQATDDAKRLLARLYRSGQRDRLAWATEEAIKNLGLESEPALPDDHAPATKSLRMALDALCTGDPTQDGQAVPFAAPLAVSTLRGELADNGEWKKNPARPAIIIGTVDMIGSKLLFSGYGDGRYGRAHHAGLIGQDALVVHDEAHLSPTFDELLTSIRDEQVRTGEARPIRVMRLSATVRSDRLICTAGGGAGDTSPASASVEPADVFELTPGVDEQDSIVKERLHAKKRLTIKEVSGSDSAATAEQADAADTIGEQPEEEGRKGKRKKAKADLASTIAAAAFEHESEKCRVLVYVRTPDLAKQVSDRLTEHLDLAPIKEKKNETAEQRGKRERKNLEREETLKGRLRVLTGTIRGHERDALAKSELFKHYRAAPNRPAQIDCTKYLVSTSAGEVGADWDADHLVCDLSTLDSMAQRFGRVNRLGGKDHKGQERSAQIVVVTEQASKSEVGGDEGETESEGNAPQSKKGTKARAANKYEAAVLKTSEMLREIARNGGDVSPAALDKFLQKLSDDEKNAAFSPVPTILPATDILFDHWSLTSIAGEMPGRPEVGPYLHGVADWEPPETHVAWRADIALLAAAGGKDDQGKAVPCSKDELEEIFDAFPLRSTEQLRDRTERVQAELRKIAERLRKEAEDRAPSPPTDDADVDEPSGTPGADEDEGEAAQKKVDPNPWVVLMRGGSAEWVRLEAIAPADNDDAKRAQRRLAFATVVLPVEAGGLKDGMLVGDEPPPQDARSLDVAEMVRDGTPSRQRVIVKGDQPRVLLGGDVADGVVTRASVILASEDEDAEPERVEYRVAKGQDREPGQRVCLDQHAKAVSKAAERIGKALGLDDQLVTALRLAGKWHDAGKARAIWQRYANNWDATAGTPHDGQPIAKSDRYGHWKQLAGYRHEFGSLHDAAAAVDIQLLDADTRDLVLHLIAAHHGWARPHFEPRHFDRGDPGSPRPTADNERLAVEAMQRFARLQQRFGRWGLAWLESILRCADAAASESPGPGGSSVGTGSERERTPGGVA